ncbi:MAG: tetratricopeptide repeat protein [Alphaproteobacteria bacterium]|nr:tetratricopeptide repeat protein [Alphaproteobacteria bacterium]
MSKHIPMIVLAALLAGWSSIPAKADLWQDEKHCAATAASGATPDSVLTACTAVIEDGTGGPAVLAGAYYNRGNAHYDKKEFALAIADYDHAILLKPNYPTALFNRGLAKLRSGDKAGGDADIAASKAMKGD